MRKCVNCNKIFGDTTEFCPICGAYMPKSDANASQPEQQPVYSNPNSYSQPNNGSAQPGAYVQTVPYTPPKDPVTVGEWMIILINLIPCVGPVIYLILLFVWAFGSNVKPSKKTFAKANLIILLAVVVISIIFSIIAITSEISPNEIM